MQLWEENLAAASSNTPRKSLQPEACQQDWGGGGQSVPLMAASTTTEAVWTLKAGLGAAEWEEPLLLTPQTGPALFQPPHPPPSPSPAP